MSDMNLLQGERLSECGLVRLPHRLEALSFPFCGKKIGVTTDPEHFRKIDISREVMIPLLQHPGAFGFVRKHHTHEGVDLYCPENEPVHAIEAGTVVAVMDFTGPRAGSPWWNDTRAVFVEGAQGVINYGEMAPRGGLKIGDHLEMGEALGNVLMVLAKDKGRPRTMLHLELYEHGCRYPACWKVGLPKPAALRNPTELLLKAAGLVS